MKYDLHGYWLRVEVGGGGGEQKLTLCVEVLDGNVEFPGKYQICFFFFHFTVYFYSILKKTDVYISFH